MAHPEKKQSLETRARWHKTGSLGLAEMVKAVGQARASVRLEMYIFVESDIARRFLEAMVEAQKRGVKVRVLVDAYGSSALANAFLEPLTKAGGEFSRFNPLSLARMGLRNHRKVLICDEQVAFLGGYNVAAEYDGDGVKSGWRDFGLELAGELAPALAREFDEMYALADFMHRPLTWLRRSVRARVVQTAKATLLLGAPGWHRNPMIKILVQDFARAKKIQIMCAYFLPTRRVLGAIKRAARRGCQVQLILPAKSDVPLMQMATRGLYTRLLRRGVEIYEYEPQILHAKLIVVDEKVAYTGSANLDVRSLHLNYELLVRLEDGELAREAAAMFAADLPHCRQVHLHEWVKLRTWWARLKSRVAHALLAWLDPYVATRQMRWLRLGQKHSPAKRRAHKKAAEQT